ncbi:MAG: FprA family A-type flavoprotein [Candidatus Thermoplasmatota archaeon]|nr:FprA family A-type flavoprotein [Candidatus Thermoplasmatota archaeon]
MEKIEIKPDIFWVGGIDWDIRNFHGYSTNRGTTYNSYLINDEKITLVDTIKPKFIGEMLSRIKEIIDPKKIDYIISNHVEMDHSGSLPEIAKICPNAKIITSTRGEKGLNKHYKDNLNLKVVDSGESLNIGKRNLTFVHIPMVHWPDSMVTYVKKDKLLLSNDSFGQHIASQERFDHELEWGVLKEEAAKYYANIVMPYGSQVEKALSSIQDLEINMIAPSHGIIWKTHIDKIVNEYKKWAKYESEQKALIIYDSMWGSTEIIANVLREGINEIGINVSIRNLKNTHISDIISEVLTTKLILLGSPTLNNGLLPTMGGFLSYMKGLRPKNKIGFVFGSYGWGGQAVGEIEKIIRDLSWDIPIQNININYIPTEDDLKNIKNIGNKLGNYLKK